MSSNGNNWIDILQERYGIYREEILMRLDYRYKLLDLLLAFIPLTVGFIWYTKFYEFSLICCFFVFVMGFIFFAENLGIVFFSDYLILIEKNIDKKIESPVDGWETFSRRAKMKKTRATNFLIAGFFLIFFGSYTLYNFIFSYFYLIVTKSEMLTNAVIISAFIEIPILLLFLVYYLYGYRRFWIK